MNINKSFILSIAKSFPSIHFCYLFHKMIFLDSGRPERIYAQPMQPYFVSEKWLQMYLFLHEDVRDLWDIPRGVSFWEVDKSKDKNVYEFRITRRVDSLIKSGVESSDLRVRRTNQINNRITNLKRLFGSWTWHESTLHNNTTSKS